MRLETFLYKLLAEFGATRREYRIASSVNPEGYFIYRQPATSGLLIDFDMVDDAANGDLGRLTALRHRLHTWIAQVR
jgi:hypothetical protein